MTAIAYGKIGLSIIEIGPSIIHLGFLRFNHCRFRVWESVQRRYKRLNSKDLTAILIELEYPSPLPSRLVRYDY